MMDFKLRRFSGRQMLLPCLSVGWLLMGNALSGGDASGQSPKDQAQPTPVPTTAVLTRPTPATVPASARMPFDFDISPDTLLRDLLPTTWSLNSAPDTFFRLSRTPRGMKRGTSVTGAGSSLPLAG